MEEEGLQAVSVRVICADAAAGVAALEEGSVQACVTSPPYWGLRDYGTGVWEGGEAGCEHRAGPLASEMSTLGGYTGPGVKLAVGGMPFRGGLCGKCGARRIDEQLGLEGTPEEYVGRLVGVMRCVRRVLRDDGVLLLNLGDSYAGTSAGRNGLHDGRANREERRGPGVVPAGLKAKDLVGIPWMVAFALRADGWWLRSEIIWAKPNPMPESVQDRPTKAHEQVFMLAKGGRYYWDAAAIAEPALHAGRVVEYDGTQKNCGAGDGVNDRRTLIDRTVEVGTTRNARSVWTIATQPFAEAHFATMPPELARRCIAASTRPGDTVLDPFCGAGTTLLVADRLGRDAIGIDLNESYCAMARRRVANDAPLFADVREIPLPPSITVAPTSDAERAPAAEAAP